MLRHFAQTTRRVKAVADTLAEKFYPETAPLELEVFSPGGRVPFREAARGRYRRTREGERFGPRWATHWLRVAGRIPSAWRGQEVHLRCVSVSEAMVWSPRGEALEGLVSEYWTINGSAHQDIRSHHKVAARARGGEGVRLYVELAITGMFGYGQTGTAPEMTHPGVVGELKTCRLALFDRLAFDLYHDLRTVDLLARELPENHHLRLRAITASNAMVNAIDLGDRSTWAAGREIARAFLAENRGARGFHVSAIGHAHIDTAWLWRIAETRRKCGRSFAAQLRLMERYPEHKFVCSQAQQLAWVKAEYPDLYAQIRRRVREGRFIPCGGTWIEPDCNLPAGESLVRQFLLGQRFFAREFGVRCTEFWNPDVFGYSAALPQLMRGAGIRFFLTQKLSWNQFNKPFTSTFRWEGLDGSSVLTHFPPSDTYNGNASPGEVFASMDKHKDAERSREAYYLFGWGDGGGGPTEGMLESLRRLRDLDGMPAVDIRSPREFFERLEKDSRDPLLWSGELYFELHRATYTTQAATKRNNRRAEQMLHDAEFLSAAAHALGARAYPSKALQQAWELTCLNQFHDILPGSSINEVYRDAAEDYAKVFTLVDGVRTSAAAALGLGGEPRGGRVAVLNTLAFPRREVVDTPRGPRMLEAPPLGYAVPGTPAGDPAAAPVTVRQARGRITLRNSRIEAELDSAGRVRSLVDLATGRQCLAAGAKGNQFVLFDDKPLDSDAWDVDIYHLEKSERPAGGRFLGVEEGHPLRVRLAFEVPLSPRSRLRQEVILRADSPVLEFACQADWHEDNRFLKVEFPLALRADHATYEIQFGHVRRPTHFNTSWDWARFEVCGHRWADLSEPDFGVALLNDCKYGYSCHQNVLRLSLLRAPSFPDPRADRGKHEFRYGVFPHAGGPQAAGVVEQAAAFNQPLRALGTRLPEGSRCSYFAVSHPSLVLDTVKKAEDSDDLIVRLYESRGTRGAAELVSGLPVTGAERVNLLEERAGACAVRGGRVKLEFRPFEIISLRLRVARPARKA